MVRFNLKEKVAEFFKQNPEEQATASEIAKWIVEEFPEDCRHKMENSEHFDASIDTLEKLPRQISAEIRPAGLRGTGIERAKINGKYRYYINKPTNYSEVANFPSPRVPFDNRSHVSQDDSAEKRENIKEEDMYPILTEFLKNSKPKVHSKRIDEKRSKNSRGAKGNKWLYPDLVGLEDLSENWDAKIKECVKLYSDKKSKLWSFEVKKEIKSYNIREAFFQAVSNSSWANFGYLVAYKIDDDSFKELRILSSLHGIGFIQLDIENPSQSKIMIPAKERTEIDWNIANRLAKENKDYEVYIKRIKEFCMTGEIKPFEWD